MASHEDKLLIEHGLLDDDTDNVNDKPFRSEFKLGAQALSPKKRQGCDFPHYGLENNDNDRPGEKSLEEKSFGQIFHLSKDQITYNWNVLGREYPINIASGSHGSAYIEVREQNKDVPSHLHGSQRIYHKIGILNLEMFGEIKLMILLQTMKNFHLVNQWHHSMPIETTLICLCNNLQGCQLSLQKGLKRIIFPVEVLYKNIVS